MVVHICNNIGKWGAGFSGALSCRWTLPETCYRNRYAIEPPWFGSCQTVHVADGIWVASIIGQDGVRSIDNPAPVRYIAISVGLKRVAELAKGLAATIHMPRIGCGLAGGTWDRVESIIQRTLCDQGVEVFVYDLPGKAP